MLHIMMGTIISIERTEHGDTMSLAGENGSELLFYIGGTQFLVDSCGVSRGWETVGPGVRIAAVLSDDTPMTMSLPPQIGGAYGFILAEASNVVCGCFDETMTDRSLCLRLQIGEATKVLDLRGDPLAQASIVLREAVVVYGGSTRSIPALITPTCVIISDKNRHYV